jgi:hypothetical protein
MDLQKTIEGLEAQAAQYTEAANALRALVEKNGSQPAAKAKPGRKADAQPAAKAAKKGRRGKRGPVSEETRAKIAAAIKARHAEKKALAQSQSQPQNQEAAA